MIAGSPKPGPRVGVYGAPPRDLSGVPAGAVQYSPVIPGSALLEASARETFESVIMLAPPGTVERRYNLALAVQALKVGATLVAMAPKDKGGSRLAKELEDFDCDVTEEAKSHFRICRAIKLTATHSLDEAIRAGALQMLPSLGFWSQPGIFSWDRVDPGSALLAGVMSGLAGRGADFGCGYGYLARHVLTIPAVTELTLIDIDRRAVEAAQRNIADPRATFLWEDVLRKAAPLMDLDFVVMNPPFHSGGLEVKSLGVGFIREAAAVLRPGGVLWLTANRHLPYEAILNSHFTSCTRIVERDNYKVYRAIR